MEFCWSSVLQIVPANCLFLTLPICIVFVPILNYICLSFFQSAASNDCPMCKRISAELKKMIDNSDGSITVDEALKSVCARLPLATAAHVSILRWFCMCCILSRSGFMSKKIFQSWSQENIACSCSMHLRGIFH